MIPAAHALPPMHAPMNGSVASVFHGLHAGSLSPKPGHMATRGPPIRPPGAPVQMAPHGAPVPAMGMPQQNY